MTYKFNDELKRWDGDGGWFYVYLPTEVYDEIREVTQDVRRGFGSVKVNVTLGQTQWDTSVFPDAKSKRYILFIKKEVRIKEGIEVGDNLKIEVSLLNV